MEGLRSYRDQAEIDFSTLGLTALIGDTGAGKSSIIEALTLALYNRPTWPAVGRGAGALRADGAPAMRVVLTFIVGEGTKAQTWRVSRIHKANSTPAVHKLECLDTAEKVDGERNINARIERLIGLSYEQFTKAVVIPQGQFAKLLEETDTNRTKILKGIFRLDHLGVVKSHAEELLRRYGDPVARRRGQRDMIVSDPVLALETARTALESSCARADALSQSVSEATKRATAAREAEVLARRLADGVGDLRDRVRPETVAALRQAARVASEIARAEAEAGTRQLEHEQAASQALSRARRALEPFRTRDDAVTARAVLQSAKETASDIVQRTEALAAAMLQLALEYPDEEREGARLEAERARAEANETDAEFERLRTERAAAEKVAKHQATAAASVRQAVATSEATLATARRAVDSAIELNARAAVAAGCRPGDNCPICDQVLPSEFTPPSDPDIDAARESLRRAETALLDAQAAVSEAEKLREDADAAVRDATARVEAAAARQRGLHAAASAAEVSYRELHKSYEDASRRVAEAKKQVDEERLRCERSLSVLPDPYLVDLENEVALDKALAAIGASLDTSRDYEAAAATADQEARSAQAEARAAHDRLEAEVLRPAASARGEAIVLLDATQRLASELDSMVDDETPVEPPVDADPTALADWVASAHIHALAVALMADEAAATHNATAVANSAACAAVCSQHDAGDVVALEALAASANEHVTLARYAAEQANLAVEKAAKLDSFLEIGEPFVANLETLRATLTDSQFVRALVAERERDLLVEASRKLGQLTGANFGFAEGFRVVDRRTGQPRPPETLSGGERFLASLALALGLVEIATRGGGQLDALFLDEGFGSLDANSLDQALSTLGGLAVGGKLVALVSHLRRVAEHVDDVLLVERDDVLGSRIRLLDPDERDHLLTDDARSGLTL
jgi:exonuclease SbcC